MTDISPRLDLVMPTTADAFSTADIHANWEKIDAAPGLHICTSGTRPWSSGNTSKIGRKIYETDTGLEWVWATGSVWRRTAATGLLKRTDGTPAIGERTTDFSTSSTTYVVAVSVTNVVVPAGNRPLRIDVKWLQARNANRNFIAAIYQSASNASGPQLTHWELGMDPTNDEAGGGTFFAMLRSGLAAATYSFSLQMHSYSGGGNSTLVADAAQPISIMVTEL